MPPLHRYFGNPLLSLLGRLFFKSPVHDVYCGLRGFNRAAILRLGLCSPGMEFALEMVVKASLRGLRITEVPTTLAPDGRGRASHLRRWRDGWRSLRFYLLMCPRWLFLYPGLLLVLLGGATSVALLYSDLQIGSITLAYHSLILTPPLPVSARKVCSFGCSRVSSLYRKAFCPPTRSLTGYAQGLRLSVVSCLAFL
jgi:hypothetical protein